MFYLLYKLNGCLSRWRLFPWQKWMPTVFSLDNLKPGTTFAWNNFEHCVLLHLVFNACHRLTSSSNAKVINVFIKRVFFLKGVYSFLLFVRKAFIKWQSAFETSLVKISHYSVSLECIISVLDVKKHDSCVFFLDESISNESLQLTRLSIVLLFPLKPLWNLLRLLLVSGCHTMPSEKPLKILLVY